MAFIISVAHHCTDIVACSLQCILGVSEVLAFYIFCVKLQHGSVVVVNVFMKYGNVSEVSLNCQ